MLLLALLWASFQPLWLMLKLCLMSVLLLLLQQQVLHQRQSPQRPVVGHLWQQRPLPQHCSH